MCVFVVQVRAAGMKVGVALKPQTPAELLMPYLQKGLLDMVSYMSELYERLSAVLHFVNMDFTLIFNRAATTSHGVAVINI